MWEKTYCMGISTCANNSEHTQRLVMANMSIFNDRSVRIQNNSPSKYLSIATAYLARAYGVLDCVLLLHSEALPGSLLSGMTSIVLICVEFSWKYCPLSFSVISCGE